MTSTEFENWLTTSDTTPEPPSSDMYWSPVPVVSARDHSRANFGAWLLAASGLWLTLISFGSLSAWAYDVHRVLATSVLLVGAVAAGLPVRTYPGMWLRWSDVDFDEEGDDS